MEGFALARQGGLRWAVEVLGEVVRGRRLPDKAPPSTREHTLAS